MPLPETLSPSEFYEQQNRFSGLSQADQLLRAAWYLHTYKSMLRFQPKDLTNFFTDLRLSPPNVHANVKRLLERKPRAFLWDKSGYYLEGNCHRSFNDVLLQKDDIVAHLTSQSLHGISEKITDKVQRSFLAETISCYRVGAFRATVVMAWNLAYDHVVRWIVANPERLEPFNKSLALKYSKKGLSISKVDDFAELKEFEAIETAQHCKLITKNVADILRDKLKRRNAAAHPSSVVITQAQADDVITDLVHNVISRLD